MSVGKSVPMLDSVARVTGTVPFAVNLRLPDMLVAKVLRSPLPHARIVRMDATAAGQLPGVVAVFTGADLDQPGGPASVYGVMKKDQPVVAQDRVRYVGEPVAVVAAENAEIAEEALALIDVEYEELPAVYDAVDAMQPGAPIIHDTHPNNCFVYRKLRHGDVEAGFDAADEIIEETFTSPIAQTVTLEPHVTAAQWADGQLTVWSGAQAPHRVRQVLAELFGLDPEAVQVIVPPLGGGYGGKGHVRIEPMVAALAWKASAPSATLRAGLKDFQVQRVSGRPVKLVLTRAEEFVTVTKHAATITIKSGVKRDGTFTARQVTLYWNGGAYADASPFLVGSGMVRAVGPYRIPAVWVDSYGIYTNLPPAAAYRGAMSSQTTWAYESHMDTIAHRLGLDPLEFRLRNLLRSGDQFATGETMHDVHFVECLEAAAKGLERGSRGAGEQGSRGAGEQGSRGAGEQGSGEARETSPVHPSTPASQHPSTSAQMMKRGRGLAVMMKSTIATSRSQCRLVLDAEGWVTLFTSTVEMGQGAHTALAQIAAEAVGVPFEKVSVVGPDTARTPFDTTTSASRSTSMMGGAILEGAGTLKQKLVEAAARFFEVPPEELSAADGYVFATADPGMRLPYADVLRWNKMESIDAMGEVQTQGGLDLETGQGTASPHWHQGAGACEVEVDTETGKVQVVRYHAASFAGRVVNPRLAQLQNDGNVIFGMGPALLEEMVVDHGQVVNANLSDYLTPSFLDMPPELESTALEAEGSEFHGIGEMTLPPVAPAIANAIFDAVGVRIRDLPITAEKLLRALRQSAHENSPPVEGV
ncbi:MAG: xanthine dehydrogenase family protein molybdopterin-binding subunit [Anaerolineae bacterium]